MPSDWPATRERILNRDGWLCVSCGAPATEVHHEEPGLEDDDHLTSRCAECHGRITTEQATAARRAHGLGM